MLDLITSISNSEVYVILKYVASDKSQRIAIHIQYYNVVNKIRQYFKSDNLENMCLTQCSERVKENVNLHKNITTNKHFHEVLQYQRS